MGHKFDIDKHALDQELRDRIRAVIRGLQKEGDSRYQSVLENTLAHLQPITTGANVGRLAIGTSFHWDNKTHSNIASKIPCALVLLRQLIVNFWDYTLGGTDESLISDGQIENHLETLEDYVEKGLDKFMVVGSVREGFWLMWEDEYRAAMEECR